MKSHRKILVIKLGALGDFVQSLGPMAAIRNHHPDAHITLLTTKLFEGFGSKCGYFDKVLIDNKPKMFDLFGWFNLRKTLVNGNYGRVYDLQNNDRTALYLKLFPKHKRPEWVGAAKGASHRNNSEERTAGHSFDGHKQTLGMAGVTNVNIDDLSWIKEDLSGFNLRKPFVLLVSGCAPQHLQKRWPAENYGELANRLLEKGYQVVLLGTILEKDNIEIIKNICPEALDLSGGTTLFQIAALAQNASCAIGNDTGPMHMIAPTGCPSLVLFSAHSNPIRHAPMGDNVKLLQKDNLSMLSTDKVYESLKLLI